MGREYPPDLKQEYPISATSGILFSLVVMLLLPISQMIDSFFNRDQNEVEVVSMAPPELMEVPPPPEEEEIEEEIEDIEKEVEPPTLEQLELSLATDVSGLAGGDFTLPTFDLGQQIDEIIYEIKDLTQVPRPIVNPNIVYPPELKRNRISGEVVAEYIVRKDGTVGSVKIIRSSNSLFENPVRRGLQKAKFTSPEKDGKKVDVRVRQAFPFSISGR